MERPLPLNINFESMFLMREFFIEQHHHPKKHAVAGSGSGHGTIGTSANTLAGGNIGSASTLSKYYSVDDKLNIDWQRSNHTNLN